MTPLGAAQGSGLDVQAVKETMNLGSERVVSTATAFRRVREQPFGEFLVRRRLLTRAQLLRVLMEQDREPSVRFGEIVSRMGLLGRERVDALLGEYLHMPPLARNAS